MDINELESFKLSDAVAFHKELNPRLWEDEKLDPEVRNQLLLIAEDFVEYLGISNLKVRDVTISGSNAAYSYTPHSDLDLHVLVDFNELPDNEVYQELFTAKKTLYNDAHDITVRDVPVELYVQDTNNPVQSLGEYSIVHDKWIRIPKKRRANFDQAATKLKYEKLGDLIELALQSKNPKKVKDTIDLVKRYRKSGLDKHGEFGPENLAYKAVRKQGLVQALYDLKSQLHAEKLSIDEYANEDYDPNGPPPGPEFKPTMPAGTVKVDVSDVYDWYKLGQHISNMKGLGKHDFGKGPPSTILSFGDEDTEHKYIQDLEKTGLTTTDIDPVDPNQPKGMKRQKTDPTYNVNETFDKPYPFVWEKSDYGDYDANAKLPNGTYLNIMFNDMENDEYQVEFHRNNNQHVTGEGDSYKIFATVLAAIQEFIKMKKPWRFSFSASKDVEPGQKTDSRAKLYNTLIRRYAGVWGYDVYYEDHGDQITYELTKVEPTHNVSEDETMQYAASKTPPTNPYGGMKDRQYRGSVSEDSTDIKFAQEPYEGWNGMGAMITAYADGNQVGQVIFEPTDNDKSKWYATEVEVEDDFQRRGIATTMYDMAKKIAQKANAVIVPSNSQTSDAKGMWKDKKVWEASGYIPSEKEKNDPRWSMALTKDVRPNAVKKNAKAFSWLTNRAGVPPQARPDGKVK